jgi:hypothetical protein
MSRINFAKVFLLAAVASFSIWCVADELPFTEKQRNHWAYKPVEKPAVPAPKNRAWSKQPIDAFILAGLEAKGLAPSALADKITLLRRVTFDLTGLPPTPEEIRAFLQDRTPRAYERVIDRLLASPRYGEKWARHWLDLARYADSDGFKADDTRPNIWRYRDYVIKAFNSDKPYDRFVQEQIAGDELWPDDPDALVATGFNRHFPDEYNARNLMQRRQEILNDITDTVGAVFLGTTYACARCHDHKYDPVLQKDYYRLQAFFAASRARDDYILASKAEQAEYARRRAEWEAMTNDIREKINILEAPAKKALYDDGFEKFPEEVQLAINTEAFRRNTMQWLMYHKAQWQLNYGVDEDGKGIAGRIKGEAKKQWEALRAELAKFDAIKPSPLPVGSGITDVGPEAPKHYLLKAGGYDNYGQEVLPGFLTILQPADARVEPCEKVTSTGRRTALAMWLTDPKNPLVARVMVNRLWHYHFGRGIVGTPNDFGQMRETETHQELLDWLAAAFVEQGWSLKKMHRMMLLSKTYQQAATFNDAAAQVDPDNTLLWRYRRQRLSGEEVRDAILSISGKLNLQMGGPGVFPEIPKEMDVRGGWDRKEAEAARNRRSVYVFVRRNSRYPMFQAFDMPDTHESCGRRSVTTTAPQALNLLNDNVVLSAAQSFAGRVLTDAGSDARAQIVRAYHLAFGRMPKADEIEASLAFLRQQTEIIAARLAANEKIALPPDCPANIAPAQAAALVDFCHTLFNANEFVYVY